MTKSCSNIIWVVVNLWPNCVFFIFCGVFIIIIISALPVKVRKAINLTRILEKYIGRVGEGYCVHVFLVVMNDSLRNIKTCPIDSNDFSVKWWKRNLFKKLSKPSYSQLVLTRRNNLSISVEKLPMVQNSVLKSWLHSYNYAVVWQTHLNYHTRVNASSSWKQFWTFFYIAYVYSR